MSLVDKLIARAMRTPYVHLQGYMNRYWLRNYDHHPAVRVHHILRADADRDMHDHPWPFLSIVLRGWYVERRPVAQGQHPCLDGGRFTQTRRGRFSIAFRRATDRHLISEVCEGGVWTLFISFTYQKRWGFYTPTGWVDYRTYLGLSEPVGAEAAAATS